MEKKLIEVNDLINMSNKRKIIVEKSEDGRTRSKIKDGIYYYSLPENLYNEFCEQKEIVEEFRSGYKIGNRVLRHAMVKVAN